MEFDEGVTLELFLDFKIISINSLLIRLANMYKNDFKFGSSKILKTKLSNQYIKSTFINSNIYF